MAAVLRLLGIVFVLGVSAVTATPVEIVDKAEIVEIVEVEVGNDLEAEATALATPAPPAVRISLARDPLDQAPQSPVTRPPVPPPRH